MNPQITVLSHFLRTLAVTVVSSVIAFASSPDLTNVLTKNEAILVAAVLIPLLSGLEKAYLRGGGAPAGV